MLPSPVIILARPQMGENIGAAGRVMGNFGLDQLRLVAPRDGWEVNSATSGSAPSAAHANTQKAYAMGTGAKAIDAATVHPTVAEAAADCHVVYATTARHRRMTLRVLTPREAAAEMHVRARAGERVGLLFGPENSGLDNDDLAQVDAAITIPVSPDFPSLNLAQAVGVLCYEWALVNKECYPQEGERQGPQANAQAGGQPPASATKQELNGMFDQLENALGQQGFFTTPERKPTMVRALRSLFQRGQLTSQDVQTLRGVITSLMRR